MKTLMSKDVIIALIALSAAITILVAKQAVDDLLHLPCP
jgi:hypothetical protein